MKKLLLTLLLIAGLAPIALAQSSASSNLPSRSTATPTNENSVPQDDPVAIAIEKAVNRALLAEAKNELYEEKLKAKDERIEALQLQIETLKSQKQDLLSANKDRRDAGSIDQVRVEACQNQLAKADAEIYRLQHPGILSSIFDRRSLTGAIVGFGLGRITANQPLPFTR